MYFCVCLRNKCTHYLYKLLKSYQIKITCCPMQRTDTDDLGVAASRYQPLCPLISQKCKKTTCICFENSYAVWQHSTHLNSDGWSISFSFHESCFADICHWSNICNTHVKVCNIFFSIFWSSSFLSDTFFLFIHQTHIRLYVPMNIFDLYAAKHYAGLVTNASWFLCKVFWFGLQSEHWK